MQHFIFSIVLFSTNLFANSPRVDLSLQKYLGERDDINVKVIVLFHDKIALPRLDHSSNAHRDMELALQENARQSQRSTMNTLVNIKKTGTLFQVKSLWLFNAAVMTIPPTVLKVLAQDSDIISIKATRRVRLIRDRYEGEHSLTNKFTYGLEKINLPALQTKAPGINGQGTRVGILDTGIDPTHPDLVNRVINFRDFAGSNKSPYDDDGHGTHVSGTIAGGSSSGTAIGIAPAAKIIMGKIFPKDGSASDETVLEAMQWMADPDGNPDTNDFPQIVSNSWGGERPNSTVDPMDEPYCKALAAWVKLGMLPVFAAGNNGPYPQTVSIPGACPQALTVGATNEDDKIGEFSARGPVRWKTGVFIKPTVVAPGVHILSSFPGGKYVVYSGTSMATPHVAGLAALVVQAFPNSTVENLKALISAGATHIDESQEPNNTFGFGRIDALRTMSLPKP